MKWQTNQLTVVSEHFLNNNFRRTLPAAFFIVLIGLTSCGQSNQAATGPTSEKAGAISENNSGAVLNAIMNKLKVSLPEDAEPVTLKRVIDGDSLEVDSQGTELEVRLLGYNAAESKNLRGDTTCGSEKATELFEQFLAIGDNLFLLGDTTDRYGRTLADLYVTENGSDYVSAVEFLIANGAGLARESGKLANLMSEAADAQLGIWGAWCDNQASKDLAISETQVNPPGRDEENLNAEWVEIENSGTEVIDLDAWMIRDYTTTNRFELSGQMQPGATLKVRSGKGNNTNFDFYLNSDGPVFSNKFEVVVLVDPSGNFAAWKFLDSSR